MGSIDATAKSISSVFGWQQVSFECSERAAIKHLTYMLFFQRYGPLARYVKLWVAHAPGMLGTVSPPPRVGDRDMHLVTCVTHMLWCMPVSLTIGLLWSRRRGKRSRHSRRMRNPQFCVSGKRPMVWYKMTNPVLIYKLHDILLCIEIYRSLPFIILNGACSKINTTRGLPILYRPMAYLKYKKTNLL